jgi:hypothetical protein
VIANLQKLLARLSAFDWGKLAANAAALLSAFAGPGVLESMGDKNAVRDGILLGFLIKILTDAANTIKQPSAKPGTYPVVSTQANPTVASLTTAKAIADPSTEVGLPPPGTKV